MSSTPSAITLLSSRFGLYLVPGWTLTTVLALIKQMEAKILGLRQVRHYVHDHDGRKMMDDLILEAETKLAEIKRKLIQ